MLAALFCVEETLGVFVLIRWDSCGHLDSAYVPPGLHKQAPFIIFLHSLSNWATSPSAVTHPFLYGEQWRRTDAPGPAQACRGAPACVFELHIWTAEPCIDTKPIQGLLFLFLPCWCLSVSLPRVEWRSGNNVAYQFACGQGYITPGPEAAWQRSLSPSLGRALSISFPRVPELLNFGPFRKSPYFIWGACRCMRIADTFNLSSIARWHPMGLWVCPVKHTIKCPTRWETWLRFV